MKRWIVTLATTLLAIGTSNIAGAQGQGCQSRVQKD
jgi:hypothetical protein